MCRLRCLSHDLVSSNGTKLTTQFTLNLGFSNPVEYPVPDGIEISLEQKNQVVVKGIDKRLVGSVAAEIRQFRPPEPYKGKGVKYLDEHIRRKVGKTGA